MPRGDRTGPMGMGPMTGRAAGYCAGYAVPGFVNQAVQGGYGGGRGFGRGGGGGGGWRHRHWYYATGMPGWQRAGAPWHGQYSGPAPGGVGPYMTKEQELNALKQQVQYLEEVLEDMKKRINEGEDSAEDLQTP